MQTPTADRTTAYSRARLARDVRFDGLFYIAVRSTGIYCRPICPAPTAHERNVRYFEHAAAAAAAGYRPCLRCRPELAPGLAPCDASERSFELAWQRIRDGALNTGSLAQLATELTLSERQLRRLFVQRLGVAPLAVHATQRLLLAKQLLTETQLPVTDIAYASGYRSLRRFNDAFGEGCGMPPSRLRKTALPLSTESLTLKLLYRPPFDFAALLQFLGSRAIAGIERVDNTSYWRLIGPATTPGWIGVTHDPAANALRLRIETRALGQLPDLLRRVRRLFDLDAQPSAIHEALSGHPRLAALLARSPGRRVAGAFDGFETAVRAVLGQQISVAAARTLCNRLVERFGEPVALPDSPAARLFPTPAALAIGDVRAIGLPVSRAGTLSSLAQAVATRAIDLERTQPITGFVKSLRELPGIGPWTAQYIAMRCLHHPDAFPAGDLVIRKQLGDGTPISRAEAEAQSEQWRPWRAYAAIHLWAAANASAASSLKSKATQTATRSNLRDRP